MADFILNLKGSSAQWSAGMQQAANEAAKLDLAAKRLALSQAREARQAADAQAREAKRAADAAIKESDRTAKEAKKAADAAAKEAQKLGDQQAREAKKAADAAVRESQKVADAAAREARKAADTQAKESQRSADAQAREAKKLADLQDRYLLQEYRARVRYEGQKQKEAQRTAGFTDQLGNAVLGLVGGYSALSFAVELLKGIGDATKAAAEHQKELADQVIRQRDTLRELQSMKGGQATTQATIEHAQFAGKAGLTVAEATKFRTSFAGSAAQYEGRTLSKKEFAEYEQLMAQEAAVTGIDADVLGDLSGKTAGFRNFGKYGDQAAETAAGEFHQNLSILQHGSGGNKTLATEMARTTARMLSDQETKGTFKSSKEAAIFVSALAEAGDEGVETYARAAVRGLRGLDERDPRNKQAELLKKAKITLADSPQQAAEKLAPVVDELVKAGPKGTTVQDVLKTYFHEEREAQAIAVLLNKGTGKGGLFEEREAFAATMEGRKPGEERTDEQVNAARAAAFQASLDKARTDPNNAQAARLAEAALEQSKIKGGARTVKYETLRTRALADLMDPDRPGGKAIDTDETNKVDFLKDKATPLQMARTTFGLSEGAREERIKTQMAIKTLLNARKAGVAVDETKFGIRAVLGTKEQSAQAFEELFKQIEDTGMNPLTGEKNAMFTPPGMPGGPDAGAVAGAVGGAAGPPNLGDPATMQLLGEIRDRLAPPGPAPLPPAAVPPPSPPPRPVNAAVGR